MMCRTNHCRTNHCRTNDCRTNDIASAEINEVWFRKLTKDDRTKGSYSEIKKDCFVKTNEKHGLKSLSIVCILVKNEKSTEQIN